MKLVVVVGAATPPGRLSRAIDAMSRARSANQSEDDFNIINLAIAKIDECDGRSLSAYGLTTRRAVQAVEGASAVIIAAPVYRASFPGVLKNFLDIVPVEALSSKPVGIVAMGSSLHHYLGADSQLRFVLAWFGALVAPTSVYLTGKDFADGKISSESALQELLSLCETLNMLAKAVDGKVLGPAPLASRLA